MKAAIIAGCVVLSVLTTAPGAHAEPIGCLVDDPTSTPLNVRNQPDGKILFTLPNGTFVTVQSGTEKWSKIFIPLTRHRRNQEGWVFTAFLHCKLPDAILGAWCGSWGWQFPDDDASHLWRTDDVHDCANRGGIDIHPDSYDYVRFEVKTSCKINSIKFVRRGDPKKRPDNTKGLRSQNRKIYRC